LVLVWYKKKYCWLNAANRVLELIFVLSKLNFLI